MDELLLRDFLRRGCYFATALRSLQPSSKLNFEFRIFKCFLFILNLEAHVTKV